MELSAAKCPVCGADIQVNSEVSSCFCMYCGSQIQVDNAIKNATVDGIATSSSLMIRANQFLQMSDYEKANDYFSRVLDIEPQNSEALFGQLLAQLHCKTPNNITNYIEDNPLYKMAYCYGNDDFKQYLTDVAYSARQTFENKMNTYLSLQNTISIEDECLYNLVGIANDEPFEEDDFKKWCEVFCNYKRFNHLYNPAIVVFDDDYSDIQGILPMLEGVVQEGIPVIIFVKNFDDELLETLRVNAMRGILDSALIAVKDTNTLRKIASFVNTPVFNKQTVSSGCHICVQEIFMENDKIIIVK